MKKKPDPSIIHPIAGYDKEIYVMPTINNPNIIVGDFTYIADSEFESHVTHHYEWNGDKLIIGEFCQIAAGAEFVINGANHQMNALSTYPFYTLEGWDMNTPALEDAFSVEIIEMHHNTKLDSPSGTALLLADTINDASMKKKEYLYGRHSKHDEFSMNNIGIHAVRGGTVPGTHLVLYSGQDEVIELKHQIFSRSVFAYGALAAAEYLMKQAPGRYTMSDLMEEI